jgi:hypothetical protein
MVRADLFRLKITVWCSFRNERGGCQNSYGHWPVQSAQNITNVRAHGAAQQSRVMILDWTVLISVSHSSSRDNSKSWKRPHCRSPSQQIGIWLHDTIMISKHGATGHKIPVPTEAHALHQAKRRLAAITYVLFFLLSGNQTIRDC